MNIQNIKAGDIYKNYKELCAVLEEVPKAGDSKIKQLKEMESLFQFHKDGWKYIIDEIYEKPKIAPATLSTPIISTKQKKRKQNTIPYQFTKYVQTILMHHLLYESKTPGVEFLSKTDIYKILGLVNEDFGEIEKEKDFLLNNKDVSSKELSYVKQQAISKANSVFKNALNSLRRQRLIAAKDVIIIVDTQAKVHEATIDEEKSILKIERKVLTQFGYSSIDDVFKYNKTYAFYNEVQNHILQHDWSGYYRRMRIIFNEDHIFEALQAEENELYKEQLNSNMCSFLENKISQEHKENQLALATEDFRKEWEKRPENVMNKLTHEECMNKHKAISDAFIKYIKSDS